MSQRWVVLIFWCYSPTVYFLDVSIHDILKLHISYITWFFKINSILKTFSTYKYSSTTWFFFIVIKNKEHELYSLNNISSAQDSIINYRDTIIQQTSRMFSSCMIETLYPLDNISFPPPPTPQPPATTIPLSAYMRVITLDTSCKWDRAVFFFLWLAYFT